jgi:glycosyltransferase involved in cell wall biosynthesis
VSDYSKRQLERFEVIPPGKAQVIHNGADHIHRVRSDPTTLKRYNLSKHGYLLAIGNLAPHKNLAMLIEAAAARDPGSPELIIAGGAKPHVFADAGIIEKPNTRLIGRVADTELKCLYENALALAFPSRSEGFGLPPLEAMNCGCPVIASPAGAIKEVCGDAAIYAAPEDPREWSTALAAIAQDKTLRERLSTLGRHRAARFTWAAAAEAYLELINKFDSRPRTH